MNRVSGNLIVSLLSTSNAFLFYLLFPRQMLMHANAIFWRFFEIPLFRVLFAYGHIVVMSREKKGSQGLSRIIIPDIQSNCVVDTSNGAMHIEGSCLNQSPFGPVYLMNE